jgi:hypothetical protein
MDNLTKAARFERPDYIPMKFSINTACWNHYDREALFDLMEEHKFLFPDFKRPAADWKPYHIPVARKDAPYTDPMGCTWVTTDDGITGTVKHHPLEDWSAFGTTWHMPDPNTTDGLYTVDWTIREKAWSDITAQGKTFRGSLRHGHTFLQLCDLRGYENLMFDMADEEPLLYELLDQLTEFNLSIVKRYVSNQCASMGYPEDLGMQVGPMLSPSDFRKYIKPCYEKLIKPAKDAGIPIHMHSDGDVRTLVDDIVDSGVEIINLQDLVNGVDWIAERFRGKTCVELDIDRQTVTVHGTPKQIDALIHEEVAKISTRDGGLCMIYGLYPGVPLENVKAVMDAMERYSFFYS